MTKNLPHLGHHPQKNPKAKILHFFHCKLEDSPPVFFCWDILVNETTVICLTVVFKTHCNSVH